MAIKHLQGHNKRHRAIERMKNRANLPNLDERRKQDIQIIDVALKALYNDGDKVTRSLHSEILRPSGIKISERDTERIWDIMINTGLANSVIGFGNSGKLTLTNDGYQLMNQFGSYGAFIEERTRQQNQQQQGGQNLVFPQIFIDAAEEKEAGEESEEEENKATGETNKIKK